MVSTSILLFCIVITLSYSITIQNLPNTSNQNVSIYLQDISNAECPHKWIIDIKILNHAIDTWVRPTSYTHNTPYGDRYTWDCSQSSYDNCEYVLPLTIKLPTNNDQMMDLVDVITDFNPHSIFKTTCDLCIDSTQSCINIIPATPYPSISPTNSISTNNIMIKNHIDTQEWWVAFYLDNIDTSCNKNISNVEISDNVYYKNNWVSYDPDGLVYGHYAFNTQNAKYILPLSVRITIESDIDGISDIIYGCDVITSWDGLMTFDFGANLCQDYSDMMVNACDTSSTPTLFPSEPINTESSVTNEATVYPTQYIHFEASSTVIELSGDEMFESTSDHESVVFEYLVYIIIGSVIMFFMVILGVIIYKCYNNKKKKKESNTMSKGSQTNTDSETSLSSDEEKEKEKGKVKEKEPGICSSTIVIKIDTKMVMNEGIDLKKGVTLWEDKRNSSDELYNTPKMTEMIPGITTNNGQRMGEKSFGIDHLDLNQMSSINSEQLYHVVDTADYNTMTVFPNRT